MSAADEQTFGDADEENQCFSATQGGGGGAAESEDGEPLFVGRVTVPTAFYSSAGEGDDAVLTPRKVTRRDSAGNVIVFFKADNPIGLPLDGSHCWLFRAGRLNQWFSSRDQ